MGQPVWAATGRATWMKSAADFLEFELAARLRDELKELKKEIQELSE